VEAQIANPSLGQVLLDAQAPRGYPEYEKGLRELRLGALEAAESQLRQAIQSYPVATAEAVVRARGLRLAAQPSSWSNGICAKKLCCQRHGNGGIEPRMGRATPSAKWRSYGKGEVKTGQRKAPNG
jgi:hypothetical protein